MRENKEKDELEAEMGVVMALQKGTKKGAKYVSKEDSTDLALFARTSEEDILGWDRQRIVDALRDSQKTLSILVLDDSSTVDDFSDIEKLLMSRADQFGIKYKGTTLVMPMCDTGTCALN